MMQFLFQTGENRCIHFFGNANEAMPSQETPETKNKKSQETGDDNHEKETEEAQKRILQGEDSRKTPLEILLSTEAFQKKINAQNSIESDINDAVATASKDAADIAEESADISATAGLSDASDEIGKKPAPNEAPDIVRVEGGNEARPTETKAEDTAKREADATERTKPGNAQLENPEVGTSRS
ncbi:MAG TPA: hypothetical protein VJB82_04475 [Candidatus Peribacterales bacterium]|nr:hypothetical protein [Candidatus Peribacterales bacterium]